MLGPYTYSHSERVAALLIIIASEMGFSEEDIEKVHIAAKLQGIGKIVVNNSGHNKERKLSQEELIHMQSHYVIGYNNLSKIDIIKKIEVIVPHHHERNDGKDIRITKRGRTSRLNQGLLP